MGMDLDGVGGYFRFNCVAWGQVLELAMLDQGGYHRGTIKDRSTTPPWNGGYASNDGQMVTAADAANLADALDTAFDDLPDQYVSIFDEHVDTDPLVQTVMGDLSPGSKVFTYGHAPDASSVEFWSGLEHKTYLRDFITYCRSGSFCIF